ncbi:hypothetical protein EIP86_000053 [Pleurotus ostreatoroseus]|nr:hypothetical protein EIP86_000053 [Pleurotus ostreatoroseus]
MSATLASTKRTASSSHRARLYLPQSPAAPPIPPRLVGSPLLTTLAQPTGCRAAARQQMWIDGDEFGAHAPAEVPCPPRCPCRANTNMTARTLPPARGTLARLSLALDRYACSLSFVQVTTIPYRTRCYTTCRPSTNTSTTPSSVRSRLLRTAQPEPVAGLCTLQIWVARSDHERFEDLNTPRCIVRLARSFTTLLIYMDNILPSPRTDTPPPRGRPP